MNLVAAPMNDRNGTSVRNRPIRAVILAPDSDGKKRLADWLRGCDDVSVVDSRVDANGSADALRRHRPDVVFADLDLGGADAITFLSALPEDHRPLAVILAATGDHALRAFEHDTVDYLVAPFGAQRLDAALDRVRRRLSTRVTLGTGAPALEKLPVRINGRILLLRFEEIRLLRARNLKTEIVGVATGHLVNHSLGELASKLPPGRFLRVHRSVIVNLSHVRQLHAKAHGDGDLVLSDGTRVSYTRTHRRALVEALSGNNGRSQA